MEPRLRRKPNVNGRGGWISCSDSSTKRTYSVCITGVLLTENTARGWVTWQGVKSLIADTLFERTRSGLDVPVVPRNESCSWPNFAAVVGLSHNASIGSEPVVFRFSFAHVRLEDPFHIDHMACRPTKSSSPNFQFVLKTRIQGQTGDEVVGSDCQIAGRHVHKSPMHARDLQRRQDSCAVASE